MCNADATDNPAERWEIARMMVLPRCILYLAFQKKRRMKVPRECLDDVANDDAEGTVQQKVNLLYRVLGILFFFLFQGLENGWTSEPECE